MRQWISVFVLLFIVALMAMFVVSGLVIVVGTSTMLQRTVVTEDDLDYDAMVAACEPYELLPCVR